MSKGPSVSAATKAVDIADAAMFAKHRMRLRGAYRAALIEIVGPGSYDDIDLRSEDILDQMVKSLAERGQGSGRLDAGASAIAAIQKAIDPNASWEPATVPPAASPPASTR